MMETGIMNSRATKLVHPRRKLQRSRAATAAKAHSPELRDDQSKTERVYSDLRRRIRELELAPGLRLDKNEIAVEYQVSRAPVSEAIARLAAEGLVEVFPQSGSFVTDIRLEDVRENLLIRTGLEIEVVRRAALLADSALLARLDANLDAQATAVKRGELAKLDELDAAFHTLLVGAVNSPGAARLIDRTRAILDRPRFNTLPEQGRPNDTVAEHRRIVDAIRTRDPEFAGAAMRVHLTMVAQAIERNIAEIQAEAQQGKLRSARAAH
jgi:GntR family transcriptional regulator, rspAB operon transcriptional repressor